MLNDGKKQGPITLIKDVDIICGRRGLGVKHPGNQSYRKIVCLNKQHYATAAKTDKLRISKSIVAAIREIGGRFLEREDGKISSCLKEKDEHGHPVTWRDIGDKRSTEKTSQALRGGQPKLLTKLAQNQGVGVLSQAANMTNVNHTGVAPQSQSQTMPQFGQLTQHGKLEFQEFRLQPPVRNTLQDQQCPSLNNRKNSGDTSPATAAVTATATPPTKAATVAGAGPIERMARQREREIEGQIQRQRIEGNRARPGHVTPMAAAAEQDARGPIVAAARAAAMTAAPPVAPVSSMAEGQAFSSLPRNTLVENSAPPPADHSNCMYDSCGSAGTIAVDNLGHPPISRSVSKKPHASCGEEDSMPLPFRAGGRDDGTDGHIFSTNMQQQLMSCLSAYGEGGARTSKESATIVANKRPSATRQLVSQRPSTRSLSFTSNFSELSICCDDSSLDSAMDALKRESEFDMIGELEAGEMSEAPLSGSAKPRRSILRKVDEWPQALNNPVDPGMVFTSTLDTTPGGTNSGTDVSALLGVRRKSVVEFKIGVDHRRLSQMSLCSASTDFGTGMTGIDDCDGSIE